MHIDEAIKRLQQEKKSGVKNLVVAWWTSELFDRKDDANWAVDAEYVEDNMDWSNAHEQISDILDQFIDE